MIVNKITVDSLFQEKFRDFEIIPNDIIWLEIKSRLQVNTQIKVKELSSLFVSVIGVLTSIVIGFFITNTVIHRLENNGISQGLVAHESINNQMIYNRDRKDIFNHNVSVLMPISLSSLKQRSLDEKGILQKESFSEIVKLNEIFEEEISFNLIQSDESQKDVSNVFFSPFVSHDHLVNNTKEVQTIAISKQNVSTIQNKIQLKPIVILSHTIKNTEVILNENAIVSKVISSPKTSLNNDKILELTNNMEELLLTTLYKDPLDSKTITIENRLITIDNTSEDLNKSSVLKSNLDIPLRNVDDSNSTKNGNVDFENVDVENGIMLDKTNIDLFLDDQIEKDIKNYSSPMASIDFNIEEGICF